MDNQHQAEDTGAEDAVVATGCLDIHVLALVCTNCCSPPGVTGAARDSMA